MSINQSRISAAIDLLDNCQRQNPVKSRLIPPEILTKYKKKLSDIEPDLYRFLKTSLKDSQGLFQTFYRHLKNLLRFLIFLEKKIKLRFIMRFVLIRTR